MSFEGRKKLRKSWFMELPNGYYVLSNTYPPEYIRTDPDREEQWEQFKREHAGRMVDVYSQWQDCKEAIEKRKAAREASRERKGNIVSLAEICEAYASGDETSPDNPPGAEKMSSGTYRERLTKKLLMSLPTGAMLASAKRGEMRAGPAMHREVPPLPEREGLWLEIKNQQLEGRTFDIHIPEK